MALNSGVGATQQLTLLQYKCVDLQAGSCFTEREFLDGLRSKVV